MADDTAAYLNRVRAEIEAEAADRRRRDPELERLERDIERAWTEVAPPGAAGNERELLLDRAERLSMIDVDVPIGSRPGIRQVKGVIRKGIYWYLRYVTDQLNALHGVLTRVIRRIDERVVDLEEAVALGVDDSALIDPPPSLGPAAATAVASAGEQARSGLVLWCGDGSVVRACRDSGIVAHGVDTDPMRIVDGVGDGLDLRVGDPASAVAGLERGAVDFIVALGGVELWTPAAAWRWSGEAETALEPGGTVVVAVADPARRDGIEAELRQGRGLSPEAWAHVLERRGFIVSIDTCDDPRVDRVVVARRQ